MTRSEEFIEFMVRANLIRFGQFVTKGGRETPFFIDTGNCCTGSQVTTLGRYYANAIATQFGDRFDVLFGPAYKGVPLVVTTAAQLHLDHGIDRAFCFNRKETKDYGEGGVLVGRKFKDGDRVIIVEDVITAGASLRQTVPILKAAAKLKIVGLVVSVDRMERGTGQKSALVEAQETLGCPVLSIATLRDIVLHLHNRPVDGRVVLDDAMRARMEAYARRYGFEI
jgi:orotate phosphoribosyltransferase